MVDGAEVDIFGFFATIQLYLAVSQTQHGFGKIFFRVNGFHLLNFGSIQDGKEIQNGRFLIFTSL
jgi:hypothetical protein